MMRKKMIDAIKEHARGHIEKHKMNVEVYLTNPVGVGEHPDIIEAVEKELDLITDEELSIFVESLNDDELDENYIEERAPLTIMQRIKRGRMMKRLAPRFKRLRKIKKFRVAPLKRLQLRAKQAAKKLFTL